jgi:hypothetical protein
VSSKRMIKCKSARQVVVIEVGAIDALGHDALSVSSRNASAIAEASLPKRPNGSFL